MSELKQIRTVLHTIAGCQLIEVKTPEYKLVEYEIKNHHNNQTLYYSGFKGATEQFLYLIDWYLKQEKIKEEEEYQEYLAKQRAKAEEQRKEPRILREPLHVFTL